MSTRDKQRLGNMPLSPVVGDVARFVLYEANLKNQRTDFKKIQNRYDKCRDFGGEKGERTFLRTILLKLDEEGLIKIKKCALSWDIFPHYQAVARKHAPIFDGYPPCNHVSNQEIDECHEPWYRDNFLFGKRRYDELEVIQRTKTHSIPIDLQEIKSLKKIPVWFSWEGFDYWIYLDFDFEFSEQKLKNYLNKYIKAFADGTVEDEREFFNYQRHKQALITFLKAKLEESMDSNNLWIIPIKECAPIYSLERGEHERRAVFVWDTEESLFVRPLEAILALEQEGLIKINEIQDHSSGAPKTYYWGCFLRYRVAVTPRGLRVIHRISKPTEDLQSLRSMDFRDGTIFYEDSIGRAGKVHLKRGEQISKEGKLFNELWKIKREYKDEDITKNGDDRSLEALKQINGSGDTKSVKSQIDRINKKLAAAGIKAGIKAVGNNRRLEIHSCEWNVKGTSPERGGTRTKKESS